MITARSDIVGSLLRPPELLIAQKALRSGEIDRAEFKFIEDRAVDFCRGSATLKGARLRLCSA